MNEEIFEDALKAFRTRRPFQRYLIEFLSGDSLLIVHPEAIRQFRKKKTDVMVCYYIGPDRTNRVFDASSVSQVLDVPPE